MWIPQRIYYFRFSIEYPRLILFNITFVEDIDVCARIACAYCGVISAPTVDIRSILRSLALCAEVPCRLQTGHRKPSKSELSTVVSPANFPNPCFFPHLRSAPILLRWVERPATNIFVALLRLFRRLLWRILDSRFCTSSKTHATAFGVKIPFHPQQPSVRKQHDAGYKHKVKLFTMSQIACS